MDRTASPPDMVAARPLSPRDELLLFWARAACRDAREIARYEPQWEGGCANIRNAVCAMLRLAGVGELP